MIQTAGNAQAGHYARADLKVSLRGDDIARNFITRAAS